VAEESAFTANSIAGAPFCAVVDGDGNLLRAGAVNTLEQVEGLLAQSRHDLKALRKEPAILARSSLLMGLSPWRESTWEAFFVSQRRRRWPECKLLPSAHRNSSASPIGNVCLPMSVGRWQVNNGSWAYEALTRSGGPVAYTRCPAVPPSSEFASS
jgi:hypothetical protein